MDKDKISAVDALRATLSFVIFLFFVRELDASTLLGRPFQYPFSSSTTFTLSRIILLRMGSWSSKRLAGPGYIILNVLRVLNIIGLLAVVTASIVMLVNAFTTNISKVRVPVRYQDCNVLTLGSSSSLMLSAMS